jgi:hypothetical protein
MAWKRNVLVVANVTAGSDELLRALREMADQAPSQFTLLVPATPFGGGRQAAVASLNTALENFRQAGLTADGQIGDADACVAVSEVWDPRRFDEIVVCTLPLGSSKWLHAGLPERIGKLTNAPVTHVVSRPKPQPAAAEAPPPHESLGPILSPFAVLGHTEDRQHPQPEHAQHLRENRQRL